jgi:hypothetical protein
MSGTRRRALVDQQAITSTTYSRLAMLELAALHVCVLAHSAALRKSIPTDVDGTAVSVMGGSRRGLGAPGGTCTDCVSGMYPGAVVVTVNDPSASGR